MVRSTADWPNVIGEHEAAATAIPATVVAASQSTGRRRREPLKVVMGWSDQPRYDRIRKHAAPVCRLPSAVSPLPCASSHAHADAHEDGRGAAGDGGRRMRPNPAQ